jgi:hypothetical protein
MSKTGSEIQNALVLSESSPASDVSDRGTTVIRRIAGATVQSVDGAAYAGLGGASVAPAWRQAAFAYGLTKLSTLQWDFIMEFDRGASGVTLEFAVTATGGSQTQNQTFDAGVIQTSSGAVANNSVLITPIGAPALFSSPKTRPWFTMNRISVVGPVDANASLMLAGIAHSALNAFGGVWVHGPVSTTTLTLYVFNGSPTTLATTLAIPTLSTFVDVACWFDGTAMFASMGQLMAGTMVTAAESLTNLANFPASASLNGVQHQTLNGTNRVCQLDTMYAAGVRSA